MRPRGVERNRECMVVPTTKHVRPGGVERNRECVVAPRTKHVRPGGVERSWVLGTRQRKHRGGQERNWE